MAWQFILSDLQGAVHGELTQASSRKVSDPWMRVPTASCSIPLWHPLADTVMSTACLLRCYRTDDLTGTRTLVFHGPVLTAEENADSGSQTIGITAVGVFARLAKRLLGTTRAGIEFGTVPSPVDLSVIGRNIVDTVNGSSYTGITTSSTGGSGAITTNTGEPAATGKWWLKPAAEAIAEISAGLNSFEWRVRPTEPISGLSHPRIGLIDFAPQSTFDVLRSDAIYEYGTTRANIASYSRKVSRETFINRAWISVQGWPDGPAVVNGVKQNVIVSSDNPSVVADSLYEEVVPEGGVTDNNLRILIAQFHLKYRAKARQQITFTPAPNSRPTPYVDYFVGESIRARAEVRGVTRFDALFRVFGITFDIDANGAETIEIELIEPA